MPGTRHIDDEMQALRVVLDMTDWTLVMLFSESGVAGIEGPARIWATWHGFGGWEFGCVVSTECHCQQRPQTPWNKDN